MQIEAAAIKSDNFPHCRKDLLPVLTARQRHLEQMQFSGHNEIIALIFPSSEMMPQLIAILSKRHQRFYTLTRLKSVLGTDC